MDSKEEIQIGKSGISICYPAPSKSFPSTLFKSLTKVVLRDDNYGPKYLHP